MTLGEALVIADRGLWCTPVVSLERARDALIAADRWGEADRITDRIGYLERHDGE